MTNALEVSRCLIQLAEEESELTPLTPLQLQKLLYYAQGWSLGLRGKRLFSENIEAWTYGPVVREVYTEFAGKSEQPISGYDTSSCSLSQDDEFVTRLVWESYKRYSATGLSQKTHEEKPWKETRGDLPAEAPSQEVIPEETLREFFSGQVGTSEDMPAIGLPDWAGVEDRYFVESAQRFVAKNAKLLKALA